MPSAAAGDPLPRPFAIVAALGTAQTLAWASSTYLPAILASPIARELGMSRAAVFGAFSVALLVTAVLGPAAGRAIDRHGGRGVLAASNLILAAGLGLLALAQSAWMVYGAWCVIGAGMALGLYDTAFAALVRIYGVAARKPITGITLIAGFASTVGWPMTAALDALVGWRGACLTWAALHLVVGLPLHLGFLPRVRRAAAAGGAAAPPEAPAAGVGAARRRTAWLLALYFAVTAFVTSAMAAHLPGLLAAMGAGAAAAVMAAALLGPAQVAARFAEFAAASRLKYHPLAAARVATALHPLGALVLLGLGGPPLAAAVFAILHGAGNGMITIAKGTLPLALFGAAGYGLQQGYLSVGARALQALAPYAFGLLLEARGGGAALLLSAGLSLLALGALALIAAGPVRTSGR
ncbi:MAG: MFS transporter [Burkholderiales bacterium]|nr:MFS transporter [Burkholderiales bacterium]